MSELKDKLFLTDELIDSQGRLILTGQKKPTKLIGRLSLINPVTGKPMMHFDNDIIIPGATYVLEKMFGVRSTFGMPTLSQDLNVKASVAPTQDNLKNELIFGFTLGNGGVETPDLIKAVKFKDKTVSSIVPVRVVSTSADLSPTDQAKYAIKKQVGSNYYYYAKKFDSTAIIRHLFTDGTEIPPNIDQTDTTLGLLVFGEVVLTVSPADLREWYMLTYGDISSCRFNSIALVAGFLDGTDYAGVRAISKLNIPNMYLRDSEASYTFTYKVYAI